MINLKMKKKIISLVTLTVFSLPVFSFTTNNNNDINVPNTFLYTNIVYADSNKDKRDPLPHETADEWALRQGNDEEGVYHSKSVSFYHDRVVDKIVKQIVDTNPDKLTFQNGRQSHYIKSVKTIKSTNPTLWAQANAYTFQWEETHTKNTYSYIYITDSYINKALCVNKYIALMDGVQPERKTYRVGHQIKTSQNRDEDIWVRSNLAICLSHELGHAYDQEVLNNQHNIPGTTEQEDFADRMAMILLDGLPQYSYGSSVSNNTWAILFSYGTLTGVTSYPAAPHYSSQLVRANNAIKFIESSSNGRLQINTSDNYQYHGFFVLDNINIHVPEYQYFDEYVPGYDRATYAAGQIAWAIKYNVWHQKNIKLVNIKDIFKDSDDKGALLIVENPYYRSNNPHIAPYKIIDKFENTKEDLLARIKAIEASGLQVPSYHDWAYWGAKDGDSYKGYILDKVQVEEAIYIINLLLSSMN